LKQLLENDTFSLFYKVSKYLEIESKSKLEIKIQISFNNKMTITPM